MHQEEEVIAHLLWLAAASKEDAALDRHVVGCSGVLQGDRRADVGRFEKVTVAVHHVDGAPAVAIHHLAHGGALLQTGSQRLSKCVE